MKKKYIREKARESKQKDKEFKRTKSLVHWEEKETITVFSPRQTNKTVYNRKSSQMNQSLYGKLISDKRKI